MTDNVQIFIVDEDGFLKLNKDEVREIPAFRQILFDDKGSEGDSDGRKKAYAFKVFKFIYGYANPTSMYRDLPEKKRFANCVAYAQLEENWKPNDNVKEALRIYKEELITLSALHHAYLNANKGVYGVGEDLALLNERRVTIRDSIRKLQNKLDKTKDKVEAADIIRDIDQQSLFLLDVGTRIMNLSNALPNSFKTVDELKKQLAKEESINSGIYGGGDLGRRED